MNAKLEAISHQAADNIVALIAEGNDDILEAWDVAVEEAQSQDTEPKLRLSFAITLDLDKDGVVYELAWTVRRKLTTSTSIPDPNQPLLPLKGDTGTVTLATPGEKPITLTSEVFHKAAATLGKFAGPPGKRPRKEKS